MSSHRSTFTQKLDTFNYIKTHLKSRPDGLYEYLPGITDKTIASRFNIGEWVVADIRRSQFGHLYNSRIENLQTNKSDLTNQVISLTNTVNTLLDRLSAIEDKLTTP